MRRLATWPSGFIRQKNSADLAEDLCDEDPNETDEEIEDDT
ncbi:hypothetical protein PC112_g23281 [Phytophthora cactorum]|uniref:Uncharacterized protein n=1 Tax=Phytophthora cactorum TaxID=29920 RepID=A0A8T1ABX5_9STRA|nr:hypothetical protein PC112_g23281 [Phytophthora cactorum]KAG2878377.1 hypothetical protein PC115_g23088 [Phytophthora cactorum]KAG3010510.1 hypothetical protein PC120_g15030 [Phytophthora cactorum]